MEMSNLCRIDALGLQESPEGNQDHILAYDLYAQHVSKGKRYLVPLLIRKPGLDDSRDYALD
ncbi:hypothetical protein HPB50_028887 [Hyalomma asiaticum]|nr:hypothetical protein HPB50_028887 [Hyalomma asiaticum]